MLSFFGRTGGYSSTLNRLRSVLGDSQVSVPTLPTSYTSGLTCG